MEKTKNIPKIRFKGYKDEWEKKNIFDVIDKIIDFRGRTPKKLGLNWSDSGYLALSAINVKNGYIDFKLDPHYGDKILYDKWMLGNELYKDQVLFTTEAPMGNVAQVPESNKYILSQRTIAFVVNKNEITDDFLYVLLKSPIVQGDLNRLVSGGTAKGVSQKSLQKLDFNIAKNKAEQKQIGSLFKNLDEKLEIEREKHEKLVNFKKAMLENFFPKEGEKRPKIRFGGYNDDWEETQLNDIGKKYTSLTGKTKEDFGHGEGRYITFTNILANPVALLEGVEKIEVDKRQNDVKNGDLFFNISSETYEEVGMSSVWTYDKENYYLNSFCMGFRPSIELDSYFITYLLRSQAVRKQIMKLAQGISRINISQNKMLDIYLSIPSINEQRLIGSFFKNLDEKIQVSEEKITKIENFKKAMMDGLFV